MLKFLEVPNPKEFGRLVQQYEDEYKDLDSVYVMTLQDFENKELNSLGDHETKTILNPYFLKWGKMGRVLGFKGCKRIGSKLKEMDLQLTKLRHKDLSEIDLDDNVSQKFTDFYDEIMNARWNSDMGRSKRVGLTATSKALHLVAPNLFMIWDRKIRDYYEFKEDGEEYVRFLVNMKCWLGTLKPTIKKLQNKYQKSCTKIIDEYNWIKCRT